MTVLWFPVVVAALAGDVLLAVAALRGLARPGSLRATLRQHQLLPPALRGVMAVRAFEAALLAIGSFGMLANLLAGPTINRPANAATAAVYAAFVAYLSVLWRRRGAVPCGCLDGFERVGSASVGRDAVISVAALVLTVRPPELSPGPRWLALAAAAFVAALALALSSAHTTAATAVPPRS